jgi:hypothetical protein
MISAKDSKMNIETKTFNGITYKVYDDTWYDSWTADGVIYWLETFRSSGQRIRIFFGDSATGKDWCEEYGTMGRISRSMGPIKVPLLIVNSRSHGGAAILDYCIVKITQGKRVIYQHPSYHIPEFKIKDTDPPIEDLMHEVRQVVEDGSDKAVARFSTKEQAERWVEFIQGKRNSK